MFNALKIWWLNRRLENQVEELHQARKYQVQEYKLMDQVISDLDKRKKATLLRLIELNAMKADTFRAATRRQPWPL